VKLWVDDEREAPEGWEWVASIEEAKAFLGSPFIRVEILSLDHDLGENKGTGYDLLKWIHEKSCWPAVVDLHTMNPVGRENMRAFLDRYYPGIIVQKGR
jgi:hypothetical protein